VHYRRAIFLSKRRTQGLKMLKGGVYVFLLFIFLLVVSTYVIFLDKLQIGNIVFRGLENIEEGEIRKNVEALLKERLFFIFPKSNVFLAGGEEIENRLRKTFPRIDFIDINKDFFPPALFLDIKERSLWAIWCRVYSELAEECYYMDEEGIIFGRSPQFSGTLITKIKDFSSTTSSLLSSPLLARELHSIKVFKEGENAFQELRGLQFMFDERNRDSFEIETLEGWRVILDSDADPEESLANLMLSLREQIKEQRIKLDYIDLRLGNKIFYKFRD